MSMRGYYVKSIGENRGKPRVWLQGLEVERAGMQPGARYDIHVKGGTVVLKANPDGSRVVSKKSKNDRDLPVIDINSKELLALFDGMSSIRLVQREGEIYLLPLATELRKKERMTRLKKKLENGEPLDIGSLSHGGGVLTHAIHEGLKAGGIESRLAFANEIRGELLDHAATHNDAWSQDTMPLAAPMQELAFDEKAMSKIPRTEGMEMGLPCSGASAAGRAKRGTSKPEDHPEVGHLAVAALVILAKANPAFVVFENVVPYASSASASILRNQLRDLGYETHETVLDGGDFNALEHRKRWFMVAVTEGMHFDWSMLQVPEKKEVFLSEVLEPLSPDDPAWKEMKGLKAKQERDIAAGKNFMMQIFTENDTKVGTITKGYAKIRSTDPKLAHPTNPDLLRQFTPVEHARIKQVPEHLIAEMSATLAHEVLGQGVNHEPPKALGTLIAHFLHELKENGEALPKSARELTERLVQEVVDSSVMVVSEIRRPVAGVTYEGPITINDLGYIVQDIGNGVGIVHQASKVPNADLGETIRVKYESIRENPSVERLDQKAPAVDVKLAGEIKPTGAMQSMSIAKSMLSMPRETAEPQDGPKPMGL